ncbi:MAG: BatA and WFA domain-containing protein [Bacteroidota bacterium]
MTFLSPGLLWGLLALSVPIIVHFFNLQRPKEILFSNVAFVKEVKKTVVRRVKFKQWLLLLLRLLAIALLVCAFARPVILKENKQINDSGRSIAIVIDNSYSMKAGNEKGNYFQQAISLARTIIKAYNKKAEILIMPSSNLRLNYAYGKQEEAMEALGELTIEQNDRSLREILELQKDIFSKASFSDMEMIVMSDFQESTIIADQLEGIKQDSSIQVRLVPLASREQKNVYIKGHQIESKILEKGKPVSMSLSLTNDSEENIKDVNVRVVLAGKVVAINNTDVDKQSEKELSLTFTPTESGWLSGEIQIDDNPIDFDNNRYFSLYVPASEKVLVLEDQVSYNVNLLYKNLFQTFDSDIFPIRNASTVTLSDYKSIVLVGIKDLTSGLQEKIRNFLTDGGSVLFIPGDDMKLESVNSFMSSLKIGTFAEAVSIKSGQKANQAELDHPIFEGIFTDPQNNQEFDAPNIYKYYPFKTNNSRVQTQIIRLENLKPILVESDLEPGIMYTFTIFPGDNWTDLHVKSIFLPLMFRMTQIMSQTGNNETGQTIGSYQPERIRTSNTQDLIIMKDPNGNSFTPEQYVQGGATTLNFSRIELQQGNYTIEQEGQLLKKISFNISDQESQLAYNSQKDLKNLINATGLEGVSILEPKAEQISRRIQEEQEGIPLWKYFILGAILFLILEILVIKLRLN